MEWVGRMSFYRLTLDHHLWIYWSRCESGSDLPSKQSNSNLRPVFGERVSLREPGRSTGVYSRTLGSKIRNEWTRTIMPHLVTFKSISLPRDSFPPLSLRLYSSSEISILPEPMSISLNSSTWNIQPRFLNLFNFGSTNSMNSQMFIANTVGEGNCWALWWLNRRSHRLRQVVSKGNGSTYEINMNKWKLLQENQRSIYLLEASIDCTNFLFSSAKVCGRLDCCESNLPWSIAAHTSQIFGMQVTSITHFSLNFQIPQWIPIKERNTIMEAYRQEELSGSP